MTKTLNQKEDMKKKYEENPEPKREYERNKYEKNREQKKKSLKDP